MAQGIILEILNLVADNKRAKAIDIVYDYLDDLLLSKQFEKAILFINQILKEQFTVSILLSILIITLPYKKEIGQIRLDVIENIKSRDSNEKLLVGLI